MPAFRSFQWRHITPITSWLKSCTWTMQSMPSPVIVTPSVADLPRLYGELASWFHLLSSPPDYAEEAEFARSLIAEAGIAPPTSVLELGSGGGNNASHLK